LLVELGLDCFLFPLLTTSASLEDASSILDPIVKTTNRPK
jgi:hypothetical protein